MINGHDQFYIHQPEPAKSCLLALKNLIISIDDRITPTRKYGMPFFYYKGKMYCYLWTDKRTKHPYIGIVEGGQMDHPMLEQGNRKRMKIMRINPEEDLPFADINEVLREALRFYR